MNADLRFQELQEFFNGHVKPETRIATLEFFDRALDSQNLIPATLSTDEKISMGPQYDEILDHWPESINLERAKDGLPLLTGHDRGGLPVGIVTKLKIAGGKLKGMLKFGSSARAKEILQDVKNGILKNLSISYTVDKFRWEGSTKRVTRWTLMEASIVSVPADPNAGIGRSARSATALIKGARISMAKSNLDGYVAKYPWEAEYEI